MAKPLPGSIAAEDSEHFEGEEKATWQVNGFRLTATLG